MIKHNLHSGASLDGKELFLLVGDDDSDNSDDGILPSAGPTDRWNNQETHKVTAFCYQQDQQTDRKKVIFAGW